jgi:ribosomal protein L3
MKKRSKKSRKRWIQQALRKHKKRALHRQLGIPEGETIPVSLLKQGAKEPGLMGQRARFALNIRRATQR